LKRIESIDVVRGAVMILMALDHVRDFFGLPGISPTDPARAGAALFFTRWITHMCAPVFFLLTGTGAFLYGRTRTAGELSRFLLTRGAWLILLELTVVRCLGFQFNVDYRVTMLVVLWALGWSMIALAALVWLPVAAIATAGLALIAGHNLFDAVRPTGALWPILHVPAVIINGPHLVFVSYPLIPWIGVTAAGFALGGIYTWPAGRRRGFLWSAGAASIAAFLVLRGVNIYGDPSRWKVQATTVSTILSFLNTTKYPPSLLFLLMTLGPAMLALAATDRETPRLLRPVVTIGRVPLFYFLLHLPLIHLLAVAFAAARYHEVHWLFESPDLAHYPFTAPPGWGYSLPVVYAIWLTIVVALYPACRWFAAVKQRRRDVWLSYL
jgi:uncharacterized membrane protein